MTVFPLLEVKQLGKRFGGFVALEAIDLTVQPGERVGLIGPTQLVIPPISGMAMLLTA